MAVCHFLCVVGNWIKTLKKRRVIMAKEIERKFLLIGDEWRVLAEGIHYRQGYLQRTQVCTVRVRLIKDKAFITIKGNVTGITRNEYEYEIPYEDGEAMLEYFSDKPLIEKLRYTINYEGFIWEVDEFLGANAGLIIAEIELASDDQTFKKPAWVGEEVSEDPRYFNSNLVSYPYGIWEK